MGRKPKGRAKDKVSVRLDLTGLLKEKFDYLMKRYGATSGKSLLIILITEKYQILKEKEKNKPN